MLTSQAVFGTCKQVNSFINVIPVCKYHSNKKKLQNFPKYKLYLKIIQQTVAFTISLNCISNNQTPDSPLKNIRLANIFDHTKISLKVRIASHVTQQTIYCTSNFKSSYCIKRQTLENIRTFQTFSLRNQIFEPFLLTYTVHAIETVILSSLYEFQRFTVILETHGFNSILLLK